MRKGRCIVYLILACFIVGQSLVFGAESRALSTKSKKKVEMKPRYKIKIEKDLVYLEARRTEKLDLYMPANAKKDERFPGIVIIHGGGWWSGQKDDPREQNIAATLAGYGYVCVSIDYLLCEDGKQSWPQNLYDCKAAVQYQVDPNHIGAIGGSSGGHLSAMVGLTGPDASLEPEGPYNGISSRVQAVVPMYGVHNFTSVVPKNGDDSFIENFLGASRQEDPKRWEMASPVYQISKDDPPFLILHGTEDVYVPIEQSVMLHEALQKKGVESELAIIEGAEHSFHLQPKQRDLRALVIGFFDKHLKGKKTPTAKTLLQY